MTYDRYHKRRALRKWSNYVSHLALETIPANVMPRRITILLAAPPGDGLRVAREHFHEYVKPILVAGAIDWEVIEGRREGEVRAGLAEKIRKMRELNGESRVQKEEGVTQEEAIRMVRQTMNVHEWDGVKGDLIIGRHTWKEYVRGVHEGWLGPMDPPSPSDIPESDEPEMVPEASTGVISEPPNENQDDRLPEEKPAESSPKPTPKPPSTPPYILPSSYSSSIPAATCPSELPPSTAVPLPHILGFINTPKRMYRFLTRRHLAESTGASIAGLVLAAQSRPYHHGSAIETSSTFTHEDNPSPTHDTESKSNWEQTTVLQEAEPEWHKSAWRESDEGDDRERVWKDDMVIDARVGERMRMFEMPKGAREMAEEQEVQREKEMDPLWSRIKKWAGYGPQGGKGWDMGFEGEEGD